MKKLLFILSVIPIIWIVLFMTCVYFNYHMPEFIMRGFLIIAGFYAFYGIGLIIWAGLLIYLKLKKKITTREMWRNISLIVLAVLLTYISSTYDLFHLSSYLD
jgi:hypothetical protein